MKRIDEPTPNGGDYSELYWFDREGNVVDTEEEAVKGVIRECKSDGTLVGTTWLVPRQ